jgi:S-methylmethionine-dependent homocysteine/selenocysteine methylase
MTADRTSLPRRNGRPFLTDGGLETTLVFQEGMDLPAFAAFPLLQDEAGQQKLRRYFEPYLRLAMERDAGFVLDTVTWRANADWGAKTGHDAAALVEANQAAVRFAAGLRDVVADARMPVLINGVIGPRGDGYRVEEVMTAAAAEAYHRAQVETLHEAGADMVSAITMTNVEEATGIARAAAVARLPVVISFTVETDGRLPSGQSLCAAIEQVERESAGAPAYYMINCAHPSHFADAIAESGGWLERIGGVRANASRKSHAELDAATELDPGDPVELGRLYRDLRNRLPGLAVFGGCCGTDHRHVKAICDACL